MCGIIGYYCANKKYIPQAKKALSNLLVTSVERGDDATGVAFVEKAYKKNVLFCMKQPVPAHEFIELKEYTKLMNEMNPMIAIGHTRAKTQGDEKNNVNNHPIVTKSGLAIVHNGMIHNDNYLFQEHKLDRDGEVDSEIIVKLIDKYRKDKKNMIESIQSMAQDVSGSMAVALIDRSDPNSLYLFAWKNPIVLCYQKSTGIVFFASTRAILEDSLMKVSLLRQIFLDIDNEDDFLFNNVADETGYCITEKTIESFKIEPYKVTTYTSGSGLGFSRWDSIKKPGDFTNLQLNERLETLKGYQRAGNLNKKEKSEMHRIEDTLERRLKTESKIIDKSKQVPSVILIPPYIEHIESRSN